MTILPRSTSSTIRLSESNISCGLLTENGLESPRHSCLILTHILQTEMKSKVNAFKKRLQREPAFPDRPPSRRTIMGTSQIATQACYLRPEGADGHRGRRVSRALGHHRQHQRLNYLVSRALWLRTRE